MCFKKPKMPEVPKEDPVLARQVATAAQDERARRAREKEARLEDTLTGLGAGYGRRSLLTGGRGGAGFAASGGRSLFTMG